MVDGWQWDAGSTCRRSWYIDFCGVLGEVVWYVCDRLVPTREVEGRLKPLHDLAHRKAPAPPNLTSTPDAKPRLYPPVKKGVKGAMTLHTVSSTSNSAASASAVSAGPLRPLSRLRLYRTYTLVRESMKRTR